MARRCALTKKRPLAGNNVSHAHNKTRRRQLPNLQKKRLFVPDLNRFISVKLTAHALRIISKVGLMAYLKKKNMRLSDIL